MKNGYGIALNEWLFDERIKNELRLLIYISSLTAKNGYCFASNDHLAEKFKTTDVTISRQIKKLIDLGYLKVEYERYGHVIKKRIITINTNDNSHYQECKPPVNKNVNGAVNKNVKDNITSINNTSNNIKEKKVTKIIDGVEYATDKYLSKNQHIHKQQFLHLWNLARIKILGAKFSNYNTIPAYNLKALETIAENYTIGDIKNAIKGLFKQDCIAKMKSSPKHFLDVDNFETYLDAYNNKLTNLYDKPKNYKEQQL